MEILRNVYAIRCELELTQRDLGKISGVHHTTINRVENGLVSPNQVTMLKICRGLNMKVCEVFDLDWKNKKLL